MSAADDPYLHLPLHGVQIIEASAGTGKTYTLATLVTRLVVESSLRVGQILAVTFTEAATQELRMRIRERLALAVRVMETSADGTDAEAVLTARILQRHLHASNEAPASVRRRLRQAVDEIDLAAIFTIHGFCARVLREHALDSGQALDAPELLGSDRALRETLAADLWRHYAAHEAQAELLASLWSGPDALAQDLRDLLAPLPLLPALEAEEDPADAVAQAARDLTQAWRAHGEQAQQQIATAFDRKTFDGTRARKPSFAKAFDDLRFGSEAGAWSREGHLEKLRPEALLAYCKPDQRHAVPASPLFDALDAWCRQDDRLRAWQQARRIGLLHTLRTDARVRLAQLKQQARVQTFDDLIDGVHAALAGPAGDRLAAQLRQQYPAALVDEFQDTDERQWAIFAQVFAQAADPALFLIGDPKQAIYGFRGGDVDTYLHARQVARIAPPLAQNFRSRPAVLRAVEALYANAGDDAFLKPGIHFEPVDPGGVRRDPDLQRDGHNAPGLTLRVIETSSPAALSADASRQHATQACVAAIHGWLADGRAGRALLQGRPVQAGDIAVLVRTHREATRMQHALAAAGIPAVAAGRLSVFATDEACEVNALLQALVQPADDGRLRTALSTVLLGVQASTLAQLREDGPHWARYQHDALAWRARWQHDGPLALLSDLCAEHAPRLLQLVDGERRLTNTLQLAELLQEASARALNPQGLADWLQQRIAEADADDDNQLLRLESDARRVQIVTLHKSKGLEYPLVFLPYLGIGTQPGESGRYCVVHAPDGRELHWKLDKDDPRWKDATQRKAMEDAQEDARLVYVGLTRAAQLLWIATGPFFRAAHSAVASMLQDRQALQAHTDIEVILGSADAPPPRWHAPAEAAIAEPRRVTRRLPQDWWVYSFTQLSRADAGAEPVLAQATVEPQGGHDEPTVDAAMAESDELIESAAPLDLRFTSTRFGVALHDALEATDFNAWQHWQVQGAAPAAQAPLLAKALRGRGYLQADIAEGVDLLTDLIGRTLTVPLPEGVRLCDLPADARRAEIEFHFALAPTRVGDLLELLHRHGIVRERQAFGLRRQLEGLMTGKIDLTYEHAGRWYVLDYKSNRLRGYATDDLVAAMQHSEYDLQALLYTLALHRWLGFRLGPDYDYARDFGGIRYLFCRGLDPTRADSPGVYAQVFAPALMTELDQLLANGTEGVA